MATRPPYQNCFSCPRKVPKADAQCKRCAEQSAAHAPQQARRPDVEQVGAALRAALGKGA